MIKKKNKHNFYFGNNKIEIDKLEEELLINHTYHIKLLIKDITHDQLYLKPVNFKLIIDINVFKANIIQEEITIEEPTPFIKYYNIPKNYIYPILMEQRNYFYYLRKDYKYYLKSYYLYNYKLMKLIPLIKEIDLVEFINKPSWINNRIKEFGIEYLDKLI